jgi:hypothetical protein
MIQIDVHPIGKKLIHMTHMLLMRSLNTWQLFMLTQQIWTDPTIAEKKVP